MDEHTQRLIRIIEESFLEFRNRRISLEELQAGISGVASAGEGSLGSKIGNVLNELEGDLEHIQFMSQQEDQFDAAVNRIKQAEESIGAVLDSER
jgi:hypothetical protein